MKRVLLVVDCSNWAWSHIARGIAKFAPPDYEVHIVDQTDFGAFTRPQTRFVLEFFDGVCQFSWTECPLPGKSKPYPIKRLSTLVASHGLEVEFPNESAALPNRIATRLRNSATAAERLPQFNAVLCVSKRLYEATSRVTDKAFHCLPGVDTDFFKLMPLPGREKLRVGWCGQKQSDELKDVKGFREILVPLVARLRNKVQLIVNPRTAQNALTQEQMREWYAGIDVLISTSCSEGCQMPIMEAMACGRPVYATDVGAAREIIVDGVDGRLLSGYSDIDGAEAVVGEFISLLNCAAREREGLTRMGKNARITIERKFSWKDRAAEWLKVIGG